MMLLPGIAEAGPANGALGCTVTGNSLVVTATRHTNLGSEDSPATSLTGDTGSDYMKAFAILSLPIKLHRSQ